MQEIWQWPCLIHVNDNLRDCRLYYFMLTTFITVLALTGLFGVVIYLFVIEPRSKIHDL
jgi:hypothetical protein